MAVHTFQGFFLNPSKPLKQDVVIAEAVSCHPSVWHEELENAFWQQKSQPLMKISKAFSLQVFSWPNFGEMQFRQYQATQGETKHAPQENTADN